MAKIWYGCQVIIYSQGHSGLNGGCNIFLLWLVRELWPPEHKRFWRLSPMFAIFTKFPVLQTLCHCVIATKVTSFLSKFQHHKYDILQLSPEEKKSTLLIGHTLYFYFSSSFSLSYKIIILFLLSYKLILLMLRLKNLPPI